MVKKGVYFLMLLMNCKGYFCQQVIKVQDTIAHVDTINLKKKNFFQKEGVHLAIAPSVLFVASAATWGERKNVREIRNQYLPNFKVGYDDYLQYAPTLAVYGLNLAGVKGRNNLGRATLSYLAGVAIMAAMVNGVKYTAKVERPDGSRRNSFPSGHTANAFNSATFMHKEYGSVHPLYSIGAYGMATATGIGRIMNNRHWISDIFAGAGIGILSSELGYFFIDKIYKNKGDNMGLLAQFEGNGNPSFLALKFGPTIADTHFLTENEMKSKKETGIEAGLEAAYFFNKKWGIGSNLSCVIFPLNAPKLVLDDAELEKFDIKTQSLGFINMEAGPVFAYDFSDKWQVMLKTMGGYTLPSGGRVVVHDPIINEPNNELEIGKYKPTKSFIWTNGASLTYKLNSELGITAYADYRISNSKIHYLKNENSGKNNGINEGYMDASRRDKINYYSLGLKLTAYF